jgi:hypothetical protein
MPSPSPSSTIPSLSEVVGTIPVPPGTEAYNSAAGAAGAPEGFALLFFISTVIKVITVVAGVWVIFNVVRAGYLYLTESGKSSASEKVRNMLTMSLLGLLLIITAYSVAGIIGLLIFGDAGYIINPTLPIRIQ